MTVAAKPLVETARRPLGGGRRLSLEWLGAVPFLAYVGLFLLLPTTIVIAGSLVGPDGLTLSNLAAMNSQTIANVGGSQAHLNMQPFLTLSFCIALQGIFPSRN